MSKRIEGLQDEKLTYPSPDPIANIVIKLAREQEYRDMVDDNPESWADMIEAKESERE